jgi:hypothetical protein
MLFEFSPLLKISGAPSAQPRIRPAQPQLNTSLESFFQSDAAG